MIFSPSRTKTWDFCPILTQYESVEGWMPRIAGRNTISMWAGRAFAEATALIHRSGNNVNWSTNPPGKAFIAEATQLGQAAFTTELTHYQKQGIEVGEDVLSRVTTELGRSIPKYIANYPFTGWTITDVETELPDHGRARIDVGGLDRHAILSVADIKYKRYLSPEYVNKSIEDYRYDWQFLHYPWAYGEYKGQPCSRMYLCLVIAQPTFSVRLLPFDIHPETQQAWLKSAQQKWDDMAAEKDGTRELVMATTHGNQYGPCIFKRACFDFHFDRNLMAREYIQVERRR